MGVEGKMYDFPTREVQGVDGVRASIYARTTELYVMGMAKYLSITISKDLSFFAKRGGCCYGIRALIKMIRHQ